MNQSQLEQLKIILRIIESSEKHTDEMLNTKSEGIAYCYGYLISTIRDARRMMKAFIEEEEYAIEIESEENFTDGYDDGGCGHDQDEAYYESPLERL
jgi:hypothetical protein